VNNPNDQVKLAEIVRYPNFNIRLYSRENLYSVNRDFEEVVICAASKNEFGGIEIAGMGSVLTEHVKLFAPILEDVWIQSKKISDSDIMYSIESSQVTKGIKQPIQQTTFKMPETPQVFKEPEIQTQPLKTNGNNNIFKPLEQKPDVPTQPPIPQKPTIEQPVETQKPKVTPGPTVDMEGTISELFDIVINNLDKKLSSELSDDLEYLRTRITEDIGYASILNPMSITIATLRSVPNLLSSMEIENVRKKINFWRKKMNI